MLCISSVCLCHFTALCYQCVCVLWYLSSGIGEGPDTDILYKEARKAL